MHGATIKDPKYYCVFSNNGTKENVNICLSVEDIPLFYGLDQHFLSHFFMIQPDTSGNFIGINYTG